MNILITGASGFIGHHMARHLKSKDYQVRGADIREPEFSPLTDFNEFVLSDLRDFKNCMKCAIGMDEIYNFAANMGGIGFITNVNAEVMRDNVLINTNMAEVASLVGAKIFFSSSACVYPTYKQENPEVEPLKESDAYPAQPDNEYGWEKLFSERLFKAFEKDKGLKVRIARYHNIYGPEGTYDGGREKSPAAICRKVAKAKDYITLWGDGKQTRSYCYIDDCIEATYRLMNSDHSEPLNIGSDRLVSVDELADMVILISGKKIEKRYNLTKPQGVRGRNSDNTLCKEVLDWSPETSLEEGMRRTYEWISSQTRSR